MRVLKIKIPSKTILDLGLPNYFDVVEYIEVLQIYEYDNINFFAMNKIIFNKGKMDDLDKFLPLPLIEMLSYLGLSRKMRN
ncbi:MAG: hypothetical protein P8Y70_19925 [Candidatus Lokiarchaeota archaeon]